MPSVDFYYLKDVHKQNLILFCCRLLEVAYYKNHQIYVAIETLTQAEELDQLLWSFRDNSFIPHKLLVAQANLPIALIVGRYTQQLSVQDVLLNLTATIPANAANFTRILEVFNIQSLATGWHDSHRAYYQERQWPVKEHNL
jgi:DNA polymerase-3 subunit chi